MKPAFRFCWSVVSLLERNGEPGTGSGDLGVGGLRAAGIVVGTGRVNLTKQTHVVFWLNDTM